MAEIVNLNRFRKEKKRAAKQQRAAVNRVLHGRNKQELRMSDDERRRLEHDLDSKKLD
ncbi:MAG TPA: DUF4169 family protein [Stellaceae bacterium]|nr:DUF4169 family protein [Stellaceae bacterium]